MKAMFKFCAILIGLASSTMLGNNAEQHMIIFDLGGVLLYEAETNLLTSLPPAIAQDLQHGPRRIFNRMFEFANLVMAKDCKKDWILGRISGSEIVAAVKNAIDKSEHATFFASQQEKNLINYGVEFILLPTMIAQFTELNHNGLEFVKKCKQNGKRIAILSNWDPESFELIKIKFPELFSLFDPQTIIIPSHAGCIKPEYAFFAYALEKLQCNVAHTFFIDDNLNIVQAAQKYGIKAIHHQEWEQTEQELQSRGLNLAN